MLSADIAEEMKCEKAVTGTEKRGVRENGSGLDENGGGKADGAAIRKRSLQAHPFISH